MPLVLNLPRFKTLKTVAGHSSNRSVAADAGIDESTLQRLIARKVDPSARAIEGLCRALDARIDDLWLIQPET